MFENAGEYLNFLRTLPFDFSAFECVREKPRKIVISVGKSAGYMYEKFVVSYPETAALPAFAVLPEGIKCNFPDNVETFFSSHPHLTEKSFEAAEKLINFIKKHEPENVIVLLSGGSSALIEKSDNEKKATQLNEKLLKSGLPITEINKKRSE